MRGKKLERSIATFLKSEDSFKEEDRSFALQLVKVIELSAISL